MFGSKGYNPKKLLRDSDNLQGLLVVTANEARNSGIYIAIASMELERILNVIGTFSSGLEKNLSAIKEELIRASIDSFKHSSNELYPTRYVVNIDPRAKIDCSASPYWGFDRYPLGAIRSAEEFHLKRDRIIEGYFLQYHSQHKKELFQKFLERSIPLGCP